MTGRIVVGVDSSVPSRSALAWAVRRALDTATPLVLVHVVNRRLDRDDGFATELRAAESLIEREAAFARSRGATVATDLVEGDPFEVLVTASVTAELLVIGTHKTGFIQGRSIGSRFLSLAAMSLCPVAFIPNTALTSRRGVTVGADDSATGARAVRLAAVEAHRLQQKLTLLHPGRTASTGLATRTRIARSNSAHDLIDATLVAALVVITHPEARRTVGSAGGTLVHDVLINLGGPTIVVPRIDSDG